MCSDFGTWVASDLQKGILLGRRKEKPNCSNFLTKFLKEVASSHPMGMTTIFLSIFVTDSDYHAGCGTSTMHIVKRVGCVIFKLELGSSLQVERVIHVPELKVKLLSGSSLVDEGYKVGFLDGIILIWSKREETHCHVPMPLVGKEDATHT